MDGYESLAERRVREAQERGEFDNLPGAGKPLDLGDPGDEDWWIKSVLRRENLERSAVLPPALLLRKEAAGFPDSLLQADRLRPAVGNLPPLLAKTVDVEAMVQSWRERRSGAGGPR